MCASGQERHTWPWTDGLSQGFAAGELADEMEDATEAYLKGSFAPVCMRRWAHLRVQHTVSWFDKALAFVTKNQHVAWRDSGGAQAFS